MHWENKRVAKQTGRMLIINLLNNIVKVHDGAYLSTDFKHTDTC